jgi:predicted metal-dependent hydrolase
VKLFQLELDWNAHRSDEAHFVEVVGRRVPITYRRSSRARGYRLFVDEDGLPRVTIPRRGNQREAERFMRKHRDSLIREMGRVESRHATSPWWRAGGEYLLRGEMTRLEFAEPHGVPVLRLDGQAVPAPASTKHSDDALRSWVEGHLRKLAGIELPERALQIAAQHSSPVRRVSIRSQRSRWGSCSRRGTISLNWRLVQTSTSVRDYVIVHELMHLREMNHSSRFWKLVADAYPGYRDCEAWLRQHGHALR